MDQILILGVLKNSKIIETTPDLRVIVWLGRWTLPYNYITKEIQSRQVLWKKTWDQCSQPVRLTRRLLLSLSFWVLPMPLQALGRYPQSFCVRYSQELHSLIESGVCLHLKWLLGSLGLGQSCVSHSTLNKLDPRPSNSSSEFLIDFKELARSPSVALGMPTSITLCSTFG